MSDDGEAPILAAEDVESGKADPQEEHCHFHAGVEYVSPILPCPDYPSLTLPDTASAPVNPKTQEDHDPAPEQTETTKSAFESACSSSFW